MLTILGNAARACDGVSRRKMLGVGAGMFGLSLPRLLAAESHGQTGAPNARHVIFINLFGGPSQLETFDMKPDATEQIRGPFKPIASHTPDLRICEHLPGLAQNSDKFSVIRTMTHNFNDHSGGAHYMQTGHRWHIPIGGGFTPTPKDWPSIGSIVEYLSQEQYGLEREFPAYMVIPNSLGRIEQAGQYPRPGEHAGWMGRRYNPLTTQIDKKSLTDNPYWRVCTDDELTFQIAGMAQGQDLTLDRLNRRRSLMEQFDVARQQLERTKATTSYSAFQERALGLIASTKTREALNITREPAALRDRYGRHLLGQAALMARRLVEAGTRFVTVHYDAIDGYSWDSHRNSDDVKQHLLPSFDQACSALLEDLDQRGLLKETLVVATGEMGRTPRANSNWGRDHWSTLFSTMVAGGGVVGGTTYGRSDKDAAYGVEKSVSPEDLAATIYHALGIDPELRVTNPENRPTSVVEDGHPVTALW